MAKLAHSFSMDGSLQQAQQRFRDELSAEMHRLRGFVLVADEPRRLVYSDGEVKGYVPRDRAGYTGLRRLLARRITVDFAPEGTRTRVALTGRAESDIVHALAQLGEPGEWPGAR